MQLSLSEMLPPTHSSAATHTPSTPCRCPIFATTCHHTLILSPAPALFLPHLLQPHEQARMTTTMGTPAFMAPEMCGLRSTPFAPFPAEVWAVGVCLYMFAFGKGEVYSGACLQCTDYMHIATYAAPAVTSLPSCMQQCMKSARTFS